MLPTRAPSMIGQTVLHYRVDGRLGQGGMGVVFRATDLRLLRTVALKFIPDDITADPDARDRLLREARAASALDHVNVGTVFGVEQTPEGRQFIVMAHYEGDTLARLIARGPLQPDHAAEMARQVASGLAEAHARGIVHRDIKPSNVIVTRQGIAKIVDFGLASLTGSTRLTVSGTRMGTPYYMSPEQALGEAVDHRTDLWSLGVLLHEMLTGRSPFDAASIPAALYRIVHEEVPLDGLDAVLAGVIARALRKDPAERFQSARQFILALDGVEVSEAEARSGEAATTMFTPPPGGRPVLGPPQASEPASRQPLHKRPRVLVAWGMLLLLVPVGWSAGAWWRAARPAAVEGRSASPTAYSQYHTALGLLDRWEKGDNLEKAIALLESSLQGDPSFALGHARLADAYRLKNAVTRDPDTLTRALEHAEKAAGLDSELPAVQAALGKVYSSLNRTDAALASLNRALQLDPNDGEVHVALGRLHEKLGRTDEAVAFYERGVALQPDSWQNLYAFGSFHFRQGRYEEAIALWVRVTSLTPDNAPALTNLGAALLETGRLDEAREAYRRAIAINPNYAAYMNLGKVFFLQARFGEAAAMFEKAADLSPDDYMPVGNLAAAYTWVPEMKPRARTLFERAAGLAEARSTTTPRDPFVFADLSIYYAKLGKPELARRRLQSALALDPDSAGVQAAAAEVSEILGDRAGAIRHVRRAIELGYRREELRRNPELGDLLADARLSREGAAAQKP